MRNAHRRVGGWAAVLFGGSWFFALASVDSKYSARDPLGFARGRLFSPAESAGLQDDGISKYSSAL